MTITNKKNVAWTVGFPIPANGSITLTPRQMIVYQKNCRAFLAAFKCGDIAISG
jgi:hypothetical protein